MPEAIGILETTLQQGLLYSTLTLALVISFKIVRFPDLTADGSFLIGSAIAGAFAVFHGLPVWGIFAAGVAGALAGAATAGISEFLGVPRILSGILVMTALYSASLYVMRGSNLALGRDKNVLSQLAAPTGSALATIGFFLVVTAIIYLVCLWLLASEWGLMLRAVGSAPDVVVAMVRNPKVHVIGGLTCSNGLIGLCGALSAHNNGFTDISSGMGVLVLGLTGLSIGDALIPRKRSLAHMLIAALVGTFITQGLDNLTLQLIRSTDYMKAFRALWFLLALTVRARQRGGPLQETFL